VFFLPTRDVMGQNLAIGVDLGATKVATALVTSNGKTLASSIIPTGKERGPELVLGEIAAEVNRILREAEGTVQGVGIGVPGFLRPDEGLLVYSANLAWSSINMVEEIASRLVSKLPVRIQNDASACILGESLFGAARECRDFIYTSIGSGLGGAVMCNGQLVTGANNMAGSLGLYSLDPDGWPDEPSGLRGNTEGVVSGRGLVAITRRMLSAGKPLSHLLDPENLSPEGILEAARQGDDLARAAFEKMGCYLAQIWAPAVALLNPSKIVLAGGIGLAAFDFLAPVAKQELESRLTPVSYAGLEIVASSLESSAVGAACLIFADATVQD
jgi:glucokinase